MKRLAVLTVLALVLPLSIASAATTSSRTYSFNSAPLNHDWAKYDTGSNARVASLVWVKSGRLHVAAAGGRGSGLCLCRGPRSTVAPYGRWDVRARASRNTDHGFAIMLWPDSGSWPSAGEIDLAEFPGTERNVLQTTVHYSSSNRQVTHFTSGDFTRWHTYSVIWKRSSLTYLLDGRTVMHVTRAAAIPHGPMHLAIQAGADDAHPSATRARLDVDWVRVRR
jgi:hypothetical protein